MEELIVDDKLLAEFARAIYREVEKDINEVQNNLENNKTIQ